LIHLSFLCASKLDELTKGRISIEFVIPAEAGIQLFQDVLDPGACPGPDPGFAGVTLQETIYETIKIWCSRKKMSPPLAGGDEEEGERNRLTPTLPSPIKGGGE
jgi:hypothetical protein